MCPTYVLDSNVIIRFLMKDHADHFEKAKALFQRAEDGLCKLVIAPWILAEVAYTLLSLYRQERKQVAETLATLVTNTGIETLDREIVLDGIRRFRDKSVDFPDAMLAAQAVAMKLQPASFDSDLDKFADVRRYAP